MKIIKNNILIGMITALVIIGPSPTTWANDVDPRETAIDLAVGGMEEGSRPLLPEGGGGQIPGSQLSPAMDSRVTASAGSDAPSVGNTIGANLEDTAGILEPAATPTDDRSIIEADTSVDTTGGTPTVDADASLDTSAEGGLVDADATTTADVIDQELTTTSGLEVDLGSSTTLLESSLGNEIGTSPAPATDEAEAGLEADVEATGSGEDLSDGADGFSTTVSAL